MEGTFVRKNLIQYVPSLQNKLRWAGENWVELPISKEFHGIDKEKTIQLIQDLKKYKASIISDKLFIQNSNNPIVSRLDQPLENPIVWIDLEMTGLNKSKDKIIEIAVIVSDGKLSQFIEGPDLIIKASDKVLDSMDEWCTKHHGESGLTDAVRKSTISIQEAEKTVLDFIRAHCRVPKGATLAGNSIYVDRSFLADQMPTLDKYFGYRLLDVSSLKLVARYLAEDPSQYSMPKSENHRSLADIRESIDELCFYRETILIPDLRSHEKSLSPLDG